MLRVKRRGGSLQIAGTVDGQRVRVSPKALVGVTDRRDAELVRVELERRLLIGGRRVAFADVAREYEHHKRCPNRATVHIVRRLAAEFGQQDAASFDLGAVKAWSQKLRHKSSTLLRYVVQAKAVVRWGEDAGMYRMEGPLKVAVPRQPEARDVFLESWAEVKRVVGHAPPLIAPMVRFLFGTGARLGEARNLKVRDVTLTGALFTTRKGHGHARKRIVPMPPAVDAEVRALLVGRAGSDYVFRAQRGGVIHEYTFYKEWEKMRQAAGLRDFNPHDARRTYATLLIRKGVDSYVIRELLGHDSEEMLKRYAYLAPRQMGHVVQALEHA